MPSSVFKTRREYIHVGSSVASMLQKVLKTELAI